jgi:(2Fe-2S) ferredoxin
MPKPKHHIFICTATRPAGHPRGSCAGDRNSREVMMKFFEEIEKHNLFGAVLVTESGCLGPCAFGPTVVVYPDAVWYQKVLPEDVTEIVESHLKNDKPVDRLKMPDEMWG